MTKETLAKVLDGVDYREIPTDLVEKAKEAGLIIVTGASDDLLELEGAFREEYGAWEGTRRRVSLPGTGGLVSCPCPDCPFMKAGKKIKSKNKSCTITAKWVHKGYSWFISANIPYAPFDMLERGEENEKYCRGIVIDTRDFK